MELPQTPGQIRSIPGASVCRAGCLRCPEKRPRFWRIPGRVFLLNCLFLQFTTSTSTGDVLPLMFVVPA